MRRPAFILPAALLTVAAADTDRGPGIQPQQRGGTMVYATGGFDTVGLGTGAEVAVRVGLPFSVQATGPAGAFANLRVIRVGRSLEIGRRWRDRRADPAVERQLRFAITMPRMSAAAVGGSGQMMVDGVTGGRFEAAVGGSGSLVLTRVDAQGLRVAIGGTGNIVARGRVEALNVSVGGSGGLQAPGLRASRASVSIGGSGSVRADVAGPAQVSVAGSGSVDLGPAARCTTSKVGSGRVRCGG
jgi:hypothetical protein